MSHQHVETKHADQGVTHQSENQHSRHESMLSNVGDCEVLVARRMGRGMYRAILQTGVKPYVTSLALAEDVARAYGKGILDNQTPVRWVAPPESAICQRRFRQERVVGSRWLPHTSSSYFWRKCQMVGSRSIDVNPLASFGLRKSTKRASAQGDRACVQG
jgi:predicted Fe-Mo cluster-binding NifX family protein